ncbi:ABC transporter substrate-binding protein [Paenibacillus sp. strain BS8-2]
MRRMSAMSKMMMAAMTATLLLTACANTGNNEPASTASTASKAPAATPEPTVKKPVVIKMWDKNGGLAEDVKQAVESFNAANPDIVVELNLLASDEYEKNLPIAFSTNEAPDILAVGDGVKMVRANQLMPLDDLVSAELVENYKQYLIPNASIIDGKLYSVPTYATTIRLVYNKELFKKAGLDPEQPPVTFSEFREAAKKITEASNGEAYGFGAAFKWNPVVGLQLEPLSLTSDADLTRNGLFNLTTGQYESIKYKPVIELYRSMFKDGSMFPGTANLDNDPLRSAFAEGKIGMYIGASWDIATLNTQFKTTVDWAPAMLPVEDGKQLVNNMLTTAKPWGISAQTKHPEEAARVLEYMLGADVITKMQKAGKINAILPAAQTDEFLPEGVTQFKGFVPGELDKVVQPDPTGFLKLQGQTIKDTLIELIFTDKAIDPTLNELSDKLNAAFKQAVTDGSVKAEDFSKK